jgi:hypothetical protein
VLLRTLFRHPALPPSARLALRIESGMNDVILLPIVVLCMLLLSPESAAPAVELGRRAVGLFILGPLLGVFSGWVAITLLDTVRKKVGVRRDYESLYALGVAFTAYAAAEAVGGSGFLAAFAAGLVIAALDVELCDCFLDYGEASAEMFLLFTFVAFGAGLIWTGIPLLTDWRILVFAVVALSVRTLVLLPVLKGSGVDDQTRRIIALCGPRGLSSLLLVLLPVFARVPGSEQLFTVTCLVVLLSVVLHGGGIALYLQRHRMEGGSTGATPGAVAPPATKATVGADAAPAAVGADSARETLASRPSLADTLAHPTPQPFPAAVRSASSDARVPERITIQEFRDLHRSGEPIIVLDVRTERSYRDDPEIGVGAIRFPPDDAVRWPASDGSTPTPPSSSTVPDRTRPQAPGWRESFVERDGRRPVPLRGAGPHGRGRGCRWNPSSKSDALQYPSRTCAARTCAARTAPGGAAGQSRLSTVTQPALSRLPPP